MHLTCLIATEIPLAKAQVSQDFRIGGKIPPKLHPNPLASELLIQLRNIKRDIELKTKSSTLNDAIETALLNSPDLAVAYAQIQNSQWDLIAVRRQWYPTFNASSLSIPGQTSKTTSAYGRETKNNTISDNTTAFVATVNLGWTFFDLSRGPNINSASENLRRQQLLFDVSARNLVLRVQETYFLIQEFQRLVSAYEEIQAHTGRQVEIAEAQYNIGLISIADVEQIRTQQYSNLNILINTYNRVIESGAQLAEAMAMPPGTIVLPADPIAKVGSWSEPLSETIAQALRLREEIQASLAAADSANWKATSLFNTYWPKFNLGANGIITSANNTNGPSGLASHKKTSLEWNGGAGLGFTWQLFDGGINSANAQASQARARQFNQQAAVDRLTITREVEQAYSTYQTSQLALLATNAQTQAARKAVVAVQARYDAGLTDMASVIQTLRQATEAANANATATRSHNSSVARLYRTSARWPDGTPTAKPMISRRLGHEPQNPANKAAQIGELARINAVRLVEI